MSCVRKVLLVALAGILMHPSIALADKWHTSTISKVYANSAGDFYLILDEDSSFCTNANSPDYYGVLVGINGMTAEGLKNILSVALTAAATNTPVSFAYDETHVSCPINRLQIRYDLVN